VLEIRDQAVQGATRRIGDVVGWLGVLSDHLLPNHVLSLGYPVNIDGGEKLHQVASQSIGSTGAGTVAYGSDMEHGSSGGPWVQNFGLPGDGQNRAFDLVVGVTSFGTVGSGRVSSSTLNAQAIATINLICAANPGNC
jgi:hypothetical protein